MEIIFHGAAREIGKSCIEIKSNKQRYIFDAGIKFFNHKVEYPKFLEDVEKIDGLFLSHAHLDHSGALPLLEHRKLNCPIYCTPLTWKITNLLLEDSYHLAKLKHTHPGYVHRDINEVKNDLRYVKYNETYQHNNSKINFKFINAGHIPGSASIIMKIEGKTLVYTGDLNTEETLLMKKSNILSELKNEKVDILITETTYGDRKHPDRSYSEEGLIKSVKHCLRDGGSAIISVFSVGRAQEIMISLNKLNSDVQIYLDGMGRKVLDEILHSHDPYVNIKELKKAMRNVKIIQNTEEREKISKQRGIIILSSSGMVQGGPIMKYVEDNINDEDDYIILTGYQAKGTNGRSIFEDHLFYHNHQRIPVKPHVRKFDFSAHLGQDKIKELIDKIQPKTLILQHGDLNALEEIKDYAIEKYPSMEVIIPYIGELLEF